MSGLVQAGSVPKWDARSFSLFAYPSGIRISSDGSKIAYSLTKANVESDKYETQIVLHDLANDRKTYVADARSPELSPSGRRFAFLKTDDQAKTVSVNIGETSTGSFYKLAEFKSVYGVRWNEDDRRILVTSAEHNDDPHIYFHGDVPFWFDGKGFLDGERTVVSVFDSENGALLERFTSNHVNYPGLPGAIWHGDDILFTQPLNENPFARFNVKLYSHGFISTLFEDVSWHAEDSNGSVIALLGRKKKANYAEHNYVYLYDSGEVKAVTEHHGLDCFGCALDGKGAAYFLRAEHGRHTLLKATGSGSLTTIFDQEGWVSEFAVSQNGKVAFIYQSPTSPGEVFMYEGEPRQLSHYNTEIMRILNPVNPTHFEYSSVDGAKIDGWYLKPDAIGSKPFPVILMIHGGPKGMYGYGFNLASQIYRANGYMVVYVNPRGSDGYSEDFALAVTGKTGGEDWQDIQNGLNWALENVKGCDKSKVGVTGISYGGFMTNWAVTHSDRFAAAVSENGISYWFTSYAFSDIGLWFDKQLIGGDPLTDPSFRDKSPIFYAAKVNTPILLIHSLEDYRCPLDQSMMFYHVLKSLGKEAYMMVFKRGAHGHSTDGSPKHREKRYATILKFFRAKLVEGGEFKVSELLEPGKENAGNR
ncbi:MAG: S9 family peptidase [Thermoprotei archaeon]